MWGEGAAPMSLQANPFTPGGKIDTSRALKPVKVCVLTISDTRDEESDTSGDVLADRVTGAGHDLVARGIVRDDVEQIRAQILKWVGEGAEAIVTTGGTG